MSRHEIRSEPRAQPEITNDAAAAAAAVTVKMPELPIPAAVTIAHLDGRKRRGTLVKFSPTSPDIVLEPEGATKKDNERARTVMLRAEDVAYIAFQRQGEMAPPNERNLEPYKVHVAGGEQFGVRTAEQLGTAVGFAAYPLTAESPYAVVFFYRHGVNAKEKDAPLGSLLVKAGVLDRSALDEGVNAQKRARSVPIGEILIELKKVDKETVDEAAELQKRKRLRIGEVLQEAGLVSAADIEQALAEQRKRKGKRLGEVLVELGMLKERDLALTLAYKFELPFVNLDEVAVNQEAVNLIGRDVIAKFGILPLDLDPKAITVATSDPTAIETIDVLRMRAQRRVREVIVTPSQLKRGVETWLARIARAPEPTSATNVDAIIQHITTTEAQAPDSDDDDQIVTPKDADGGIVQLVNQIIIDAYRRGVSDIHVEPNGKSRNVTVRYRVDGDCVLYKELPPIVRNALVSCIKIMAKLDISERRKPQDGKIRFRLADRQIELRVATIPSVNNNEDVVMRILAGSKPMPLDAIRLSPRNLSELQRVLSQPYGLILCVGPTGSGKTTTLHSALGHLNTIDMKIWTAEDPVEITQPGLRQVQVSPKIGFTFAAAMRAFLRADPDVIMVGEMRDNETASIAVEASLTGHLVLSTLHTNSAPETITRLLDMGLDPFTFSDALLGVLAQRLARALCPDCRVRERGTEAEYLEIAQAYGEEMAHAELGIEWGPDFTVFRARGCETCNQSGYKGRLGLHELLVSDDAIKRVIGEKAPVDRIRSLAIQGGMRTLLQDGIQKVVAGVTDLKQVLAVCSKTGA